MVKIMIVTHGPLAEALKESARMFFAEKVDNITSIGLYPSDNIDDLKWKVKNAITEIYSDDGILAFVDIFAGSPFNMVALTMGEVKEQYPKIQCFTGANLVMIMEALAQADSASLDDLTKHLEEQAPNSIINVNKMLGL